MTTDETNRARGPDVHISSDSFTGATAIAVVAAGLSFLFLAFVVIFIVKNRDLFNCDYHLNSIYTRLCPWRYRERRSMNRVRYSTRYYNESESVVEECE